MFLDNESFVPQTPPAEVEDLSKLKPSEAIRRGIKMRPVQSFHRFFREGASCALGAMFEGYGGDPDDITNSAFDWANRKIGQLYGIKNMSQTYGGDIAAYIAAELNDRQHLSREHIAAWLESRGR